MWLPFEPGAGSAESWHVPLHGAAATVADAQIATGLLLWPRDPIAGAIAVAALCAAGWVALQAQAHRAAGLGSWLGALLALVASAAPLFAWQSASPLGAAPASLLSGLALLVVIRLGSRGPASVPPGRTRLHTTIRLMALLGVVLTVTMAAARLGAPATSATLNLLRDDLGSTGFVLLAGALATAPARATGIWRGAAVAWVLTAWLAPPLRSALLLPWAWWLAASGLASVLEWHGRSTRLWATAGLLAWLALHAARLPWASQHQQAALVRTWAEGLLPVLGTEAPLIRDGSAVGRLVEALATAPRRPHAPVLMVSADSVAAALSGGRRPVAVGHATLERLRWSGVALDESAGARIPLDLALDRLPSGTIVLAAISSEAAARLTPAHWQALARTGLRLIDASVARPHALVGVTGARVPALEAARQDSVRLDVLPGDLIGRTAARSPVDAGLDAGEARARIVLRGRTVVDSPGVALLLVNARGDVLALRSGLDPGQLDGPPLAPGPTATARARHLLPCIDVPAGRTVDITPVTGEPALGIEARAADHVEVTMERPGEFKSPVALDVDGSNRATPVGFRSEPERFTIDVTGPTRVGVRLGGPVSRAAATSSTPARLCAAWPSVPVIDPRGAGVDVPMGPEATPYLGGGWHILEPVDDGAYFRWMDGARSELLLSFRGDDDLSFVLDATPVTTPAEADSVTLWVNGTNVGTHRLRPARAHYAWDVDAVHLRDGPNAFSIETTRTLRPADRRPGDDARRLGLSVRGWSIARRSTDDQRDTALR